MLKIPTIMTIDIKFEDSTLVETKSPVEFFMRDNTLFCSDSRVVDYYGEFRGNVPYIDPELEKWAEDNGGYWDWENPECISFSR